MAWIFSLFSNFFKIGLSGIYTSEIQRDGEEIESDGEEIQRDGEEIQRVGEEIKSYLKLIEKITDEARQTTSESCPKPPEFYSGQCIYLADKLVVVVESAQSNLVPFIDGRCTSSKDMARFLDACKQLYASAELVQSFIQECCKTSWTQAALGMVNVSEHVSSIGFDLEVCKLVFSNVGGGDENMLSLMGIDELAEREIFWVQQRVLDDKKALLERVEALCQSSESSYRDRMLGKRLLASLQPSSDQEGYCDQDVGIVPQIGKLGKGVGGVVHRGIWYKSIDVAKKVIYGVNERSHREKMIQAKLSHSNVTYLFCYGNEDGDLTKTTLLIDLSEGNLFDLIGKRMNRGRKYPFPILVAVDIMLQVGMGMHYAHKLGIVHRDLKPQNIFSRHVRRTEFVQVKVGDFGEAKIVKRDQTMTSMLGTPRYMAPEMLLISRRKKDEEKKCYENLEKPYRGKMNKHPYKCDIHSFAMLCFEILTGQQPFLEKERLDDLGDLILRGERPMLPKWCPMKLKDLIERCWSKNVNDRPSFDDICKELRYIKYLLLSSDRLVCQIISEEKVQWSELAPFEDSLQDKEEEFLEEQKFFKEILKQEEDERIKYNLFSPCFFQKMDDLVLGDKIAEGGEAAIYEVRGGLVVKCFQSCLFSDYFRYLDRGLLTAFRSGFHHQSPLSIIKGGTLVTDSKVRGSFGIVMDRKWGDLRRLIDWHMKKKQNGKNGEDGTKDPPFTEVQFVAMMLGIAKDMKALHNLSPPILHGDIKCSNVLVEGPSLPFLSREFKVTICDYGTMGVVGTAFWRAPEILIALKNRNFEPNIITAKCDVYSYGMTCYELVTGCIPFEGEPPYNYAIAIGGGRPVLPINLHPTIKDVIVSCWKPKPLERPSFDVIVDRLISILVNSHQLTLHKDPPL